MDVQKIIAEVDAEIVKLTQLRSSLTGISATTPGVASGRRGRPKGSKNAPKAGTIAEKKPAIAKKATKRKLSPEGRKRIADAMKRRWAERRKETAK